jgi:cytochrome P450
MEEITQSFVLPQDTKVTCRKPIPKMTLIPREVSLNHLVSRAIPGFDTYGDVFRLVLPIPINIFCLRRPDHIKAVTSDKKCGTMKPAGMIPKADFFMGNGIYNDLGGATWRGKRQVLAPAFTDAMSQHFSESLPHSFEKMKTRWIESGAMSPIDLYAELQRMVLDYAASALFSEDLGADELDWITPATNFAEMMFVTLTPHWIPTPSNLKFRRVKDRYHVMMDEIIRKHRRAPDAYTDMVSHLMRTPNPVTQGPHTDAEIKAEMFSSYLGTPAMALTMLWGVYFLSTRPEILHKVREELKRVIGDRAPRGEDVANLPYLEMFVKEVLRLYPSFWGSLRYAKDPLEVDGYSFPAKSIFAMIRVAAHRLPDHWENPEQFIPERHAKRNACPHAILPFGLGPRMCLGRSLANIICPLAIASIAQKFDINLASDEIKLKYGFGMYPAKTMFATVRPVD